MEIFGYSMALIIGFLLGLIGGGGSILAVPVLAYLFKFDEKIATAYSLFIVGFSALVGGYRQHLQKRVDWKSVAVFGIPAIIGVFLVRRFVIPQLPDIIWKTETFEISRRMFLFSVFAILMLLAAFSMIRPKKNKEHTPKKINKTNYPLILFEGFVVGGITGLVGAGGGFLVVPALVFMAGLDIKIAIGTSLMIIALKSLIGFFLGDALSMEIDWLFLSKFTAITLIGIWIGVYASHFISKEKLKKGFGYFLLGMGVLIFILEFSIN